MTERKTAGRLSAARRRRPRERKVVRLGDLIADARAIEEPAALADSFGPTTDERLSATAETDPSEPST